MEHDDVRKILRNVFENTGLLRTRNLLRTPEALKSGEASRVEYRRLW